MPGSNTPNIPILRSHNAQLSCSHLPTVQVTSTKFMLQQQWGHERSRTKLGGGCSQPQAPPPFPFKNARRRTKKIPKLETQRGFNSTHTVSAPMTTMLSALRMREVRHATQKIYRPAADAKTAQSWRCFMHSPTHFAGHQKA